MRLFALATTLHQQQSDNITVIKPIVGYRAAPTLEAAIGSFVQYAQEDYPAYTMSQVIHIEIPMQKVVDLLRKDS